MDLQPLLDALAKRGDDIKLLDIEGVTHAAVPEGVKLERLNIEEYLPAPKAIRREVAANDLRGLVDYVNRYKQPESQVYAGPAGSPNVLVRLDDHVIGKPSHVDHTVTFACPHAPEWVTWAGANGREMEQKAFGEFLEDNARDVIKPTGAEMLRLATDFRSITITEFGSATRMQNGNVQITYTEKEQAGQVQLPETFEIAIPVFEGLSARYPINVRLRYRQYEKKLLLRYVLDRADVVKRRAYDDLLGEIEKGAAIKPIRAV